ncbi:MAG: NFACT family protein, partial [Clostridia bacterium]|nr:NFACT family protein [Clostridia bacterium]
MPLDGLTLHLLTEELKQSAAGSRIEKVYQPTADEIIFHLRSREGTMKLLINVSSATPHINLTSQTPENPPTPPMLCMFMRKHLTGCVIDNIEQIDLDRICRIKLNGRNEIGDPVSFDLIIELMPKHANFIILNSDGIILESVKKSDYSP